MNGPVVAVVQEPAPVLRAPLRGSAWVAFNAISNPVHRRALVTVDGKVRIAQRFAIDWLRLGPDGRLFHGDPKSNASFYDHGAEVLAVADGRISDLKDGLPENAGSNEQSTRAITLDNLVGNYLVDANSPVGAEGLPYELETFTQLGVIEGPEGFLQDIGKAWQPKTGETPVVHRREFPVDNAVVTFP